MTQNKCLNTPKKQATNHLATPAASSSFTWERVLANLH